MKKVARSGGVAGGDGGAQAPHQRADPSTVCAVHFGAFTRLRRALQNGLFLLLNFGSLSLGHLSLLLRIAQTSNVKRGLGLCQRAQNIPDPSITRTCSSPVAGEASVRAHG